MFAATCFQGRKVAVFGLGRSGSACARALTLGEADVLAWDDSEVSRAKAQASGVRLADFDRIDLNGFAALVLGPGVPLTHPEPHWTVSKARAANIEVIGDTEADVSDRIARIRSKQVGVANEQAVDSMLNMLKSPDSLGCTPEQAVEMVERMRDLGCEYAIVYFPEAAYDRSGIELFEQKVIPELS